MQTVDNKLGSSILSLSAINEALGWGLIGRWLSVLANLSFSYNTIFLSRQPSEVVFRRVQFCINKNALISVESRPLGDRIRNNEAIRPRAIVLLSSEPRAASEKVKLCSRPTVTKRKIRLLAVQEAINSTRNRISSLKVFQFLVPFKGQMNQNFDLFYFSSILVKCV